MRNTADIILGLKNIHNEDMRESSVTGLMKKIGGKK